MMPESSNSTADSHCAADALTDTFGWLVQFTLAALAFALLIVKRFCEAAHRRRSWLIWFFDTSKQGVGAVFVHMVNLYVASTFSGDPCSWYIINFLLDSTVGLVVIFVCVRGCQWVAMSRQCPAVHFGKYGSPPRASYWLTQCVAYVAIMAVQKAVVTALTHVHGWTWLSRLLLAPVTDARLEVAIAVLLVPFFVNALMFWVVDNFIMHRSQSPSTTDAASKSFSISTDAVPINDILITELESCGGDHRMGSDESERLLLPTTASGECGVAV